MEPIELDSLDYDVVVLGTGVCESMLAAALARVGKKVIVLEGNDYYGGPTSTLSLDAFLALLRASEPYTAAADAPDDDAPASSTAAITLNCATDAAAHGVYDGEVAYVLEPAPAAPAEAEGAGTREAADNGSVLDKRRVRQCTADLHPTLFFARSPMVRLLAKSGAARYLEFRAVPGCEMLAAGDAAPRVVPNSKAALFADRRLALPEKRMLMRFLQQHAFLAAPENQETSQIVPADPAAAAAAAAADAAAALPDDCALDAYVRDRAGVASALVRQLLVYGIALADDGAHTPVRAGMAAVALYARSIGAYGPNTPFLALLYGTAEIAQAFAREAAVYAADCILRQRTTRVEPRAAPEPCSPDTSSPQQQQKQYPWTVRCATVRGGEVHAAHVVVPACRVAATGGAPVRAAACWQRALVLTRAPVLHSADLACLVVAPDSVAAGCPAAAVRVVQYDAPCRLAPRGYYATAFAMRGDRTARPHLRAVVERFVCVPSSSADAATAPAATADDTRPVALLCTYHTQVCREGTVSGSSGVVVTPDVAASTDFGDVPAVVERLFWQICGTRADPTGEPLEFLPPMPDPEDVAWSAPEAVPEAVPEAAPAQP